MKPSRYVRSVMLDLDPTVIDATRAQVYGGLFKPDAFIMVCEWVHYAREVAVYIL
jgi:hypothetical protein